MASRFLPVAVLAASIAAAPSAHADELTLAAPAAPGYRANVRPFGLPDLEATSSLGVGVAGGSTIAYGEVGGLSAEVALDGELGIGRHVKLFASLPLGYAQADEYDDTGIGGVSAGGLAYGGVGRLTFALGGNVSLDGGHPIVLLRHDHVPFGDDQLIPRFFADARLGVGAGYLQLELDHSAWHNGGSETGWGDHSMSEAILGGGAPLSRFAWLTGDVALALYDGAQSNQKRVSADLGVRWQSTPGARTSYGTLLTYTHVESVTFVGVALELRADFFALGTAP
jgi:hypothetical protein